VLAGMNRFSLQAPKGFVFFVFVVIQWLSVVLADAAGYWLVSTRLR